MLVGYARKLIGLGWSFFFSAFLEMSLFVGQLCHDIRTHELEVGAFAGYGYEALVGVSGYLQADGRGRLASRCPPAAVAVVSILTGWIFRIGFHRTSSQSLEN